MAKEAKPADIPNEFQERALWVTALVDKLRPDFQEAGMPLPENIRVGFSTKGKGTQKTGEAWHSPATKDGAYELFIRADQDDPLEIARIVARLLVHFTLPADDSHGLKYKHAAAKIGLHGKMRAASPNHRLEAFLQSVVEGLGPLPHAALDLSWSPFAQRKKDGTRMLKASCAGGLNQVTGSTDTSCEYTFRLSAKWASVGAICPLHGKMTVEFPSKEEQAEAEADAAPDEAPDADPFDRGTVNEKEQHTPA